MPKKHPPSVEANILRMHYEDGKTYKEIAETLSIPRGTVGAIIRRNAKPTGATNAELDRKHAEKVAEMQEAHAQETAWMAHIEPLNAHKRELERVIEERAEALRRAKEEHANFLATLRRLTGVEP